MESNEMTYEEMIARSEELRAKADEMRNEKLTEQIASIKDVMNRHGLTIADIGGPKTSKSAAKSNGKATKTYIAMHVNPDTGETWNGRGRPPAWFKASSAGGASSQDKSMSE